MDNNNNNIENHEVQQKQIDWHNRLYNLVKYELQSSPKLEDQNKTNAWKTTNKHEGGLVMIYNNNARNKTLYPRVFYALYIGQNNSGNGHLIFKFSTKQILITPKYKSVPMPQDLIKVTSKIDTFTNKIQIDHINSDHYTTQEDHYDHTQDYN